MNLRIIYGRAGSGKSEFCFKEIANLINKEKKIYIITPEQFSFTAERKLMDSINSGAVLNAEVISFNRMAYRVLNEVGGAKKTNLSKCGKAMLIYSILNNNKNTLKFLQKSDENIDIAMAAITELKKHGISVQQLKNETTSLEDKYLKTKLQDISTIYESFEKSISEKYIDETDLLTMLANQIDKTEMFKNSLIYIDEFLGFTSQEYEIIKKLLKLSKKVTITMCTDNIKMQNNPDEDVFYSNKITLSKIMQLLPNSENIEKVYLNKAPRFKTQELQHLEQNLYKTEFEKYENEVKNIELFLAKNRYSEIENVAKNIFKLVRDKGFRYKEIAVIAKNTDIYSSLIRSIFYKYDIPVFIDEKRDLNQNIIVKYVLALLEVLNSNWANDAVFNYIKTGFLDLENDEIFKLENYCIKWGIKQSKWKKDFNYGVIDEKNKAEILRLNEIRKQIVEPLLKFKKSVDNAKTAENISKELYKFLIEQKIEEKLQEKIKKLEDSGNIDLANEYKESYKIIIQLLEEIVLVFEKDKMTFEKYINILKIGLKNSGLGKIPATADQVIVGDVERSRSHKVKIIFIIGLNDGIFPSANNDEGFLNDADREMLKQDGIELAKGTIDKLYEDNFNIYRAFTTAEEKLYLSYASSDSEGKSLRPSILIFKLKKIFSKIAEQSDIITEDYEVLTQNVTFEELVININRLKSGESIDKIWYDVYNYFKNNKNWQNKLEDALKGLQFTNMPEKLSKENIDKLYGNTINTSVSKLEKYRSCPFSYYLQYGLKIKEKEQFKIRSLDTGTFMHETIDEFFDIIKDKNININEIQYEEIETIVNTIINNKLNLDKNYIFTSSFKYKLLATRMKRLVTKALKYILETLTQSEFNVLGTEVEFGKKGQYDSIILNLKDGKRVEITGKIDRIDVAKNDSGKYLRIIDYKSSAKNIDLNEVYAGIQIQLLTYLDAVCKIEDLMPAGVLYFGLIEQMIKSDKKLTEEEIEEKIKNSFKMKGLILADVKVVKMHDKTLTSGSSKLVPAYIDKSGNLGKKTNGVTSEQFVSLQKYIYKTIKDISNEILSGKIDVKPYYKKGNTPCKYCEYKGICGFKAGFCGNEYMYIGDYTKDEILNKINNSKEEAN